jgi:hypothetical protein
MTEDLVLYDSPGSPCARRMRWLDAVGVPTP